MENKELITDFKKETAAKDLAIYNEFNRLASLPGAMKTVAERIVMKKFNIHAKSTIWQIRKRVEKRLQEKNG